MGTTDRFGGARRFTVGVGFSGFPRPMRGAGPVDPRDLTGDRAPRRAERPDAQRAPCRRMSQDCQRESSMAAKAEKDAVR